MSTEVIDVELSREEKIALIAKKYAEIMTILGIPVNSHSKETPTRVAKYMVNEAFRALSEDPPEFKRFEAPIVSLPILVKDIKFFSTCAHHHLPFYGRVTIGYLPDKRIAGLSKFHRTVEYFSAKPQVQEEFTVELADYLFRKLQPVWLGVHVEATHMCVCARGVKNEGTTETYTVFTQDDEKSATERFLRLIK